MSVFYLTDRTIDAVTTAIVDTVDEFDGLKTAAPGAGREIGRRLRMLNYEAYVGKYGRCNAARADARRYRWSGDKYTPAQTDMAFSAYCYQVEEPLSKRELFSEVLRAWDLFETIVLGGKRPDDEDAEYDIETDRNVIGKSSKAVSGGGGRGLIGQALKAILGGTLLHNKPSKVEGVTRGE
jgi:hypothetical protein